MIVDSFEIMSTDPEYIRFRETARKILAGDPGCLDELKQVVQKQDAISRDPRADPPYIFVEGSSGSGKTQFAITMMHAELEEPENRQAQRPVFYLPANLIHKLKRRSVQHIYDIFNQPCEALHLCLKDDVRSGLTDQDYSVRSLAACSLYSFGFLRQLLRSGYSGTHQIMKCKASEVLDGYRGSPPILFLDEFLPGHEEHHSYYRLLRNLVRAARWRLIVMGTETTAASLVRHGIGASRGTDRTHWCTVICKLPKYKPKYEVNVKPLPGTLSLILENSRPWFAHLFYEHWDANHPMDAEHVLKTCTAVGSRVWKLKLDKRAQEERRPGQQGQLCMLNYLDESVTDPSKSLTLIHHHFAQLFLGEKNEPIHLDQDFKFFVPFKEGSNVSIGKTEWTPQSYLPAPRADLLLHWLLGGILDVAPFRDLKELEISFAEAFRSNENDLLSNMYKVNVGNPKQKTNDGMKLEAIMTGAVCLASRYRGFGGAPALDFLDETLFRLLKCEPFVVGASEEFKICWRCGTFGVDSL